ncbi:MAG: adenine deaminase C-terminal domain-containing protein [Bacillota bacterium]
MNLQQRTALMRTAAGMEQADLAVVNGTLVNVYTGELLAGWGVAVRGEHIAYVGPDLQQILGPRTQVIDAAGKFVVPGFIDTHAHLNLYATISEFLRYGMHGGTTTFVTELIELTFPLGYQGILAFLESCKNQPVKIFCVIPSMLTISHGAGALALDKGQFRELLQRDDILGMGETYWLPVVEQDERVLELIEETLKAGKKVAGHSAGAKGPKLAAYVAAGVSSCHEPITMEEVMERLRMGIYVLARQGETRQDLENIARIKDMGLDLRQLALVTDSVSPRQLVEKGYMEAVLQKAIDLGFDPVTAIQMVTLNPAKYMNLDDRVGGIAPGKYSDLVILPDLQNIKAEYVISNGKVIARQGQLLVQPKEYAYPAWVRQSIRLTKQYRPEDFRICVPDAAASVTVRVIDQVEELVTKEAFFTVPVSRGLINTDPARDLLKVCCIDFKVNPGKQFVGLITGLKMKRGALASSMAWDLTNIVTVGADETDMALAVNRVIELQGGAVACAGGRVIAEMPLPIGGNMSDAPLEEIARNSEAFQQAAAELGSPFSNAHLTLITLTTPAIPFLRICEEGLVDIRSGSRVELIKE